ncbi:hypothetical protein [Anaerovorax odorimutans]|uniref:hypothetical protein n=1 Tax=Anaerovorax odorimutans TaxID=109327 RepID=UPI000402C494|nr:hypothetical protein [Anaerovorax odorimutans]
MTQAIKHVSMISTLQQRCLNLRNHYNMTQAIKHASMISTLQQRCLNIRNHKLLYL